MSVPHDTLQAERLTTCLLSNSPSHPVTPIQSRLHRYSLDDTLALCQERGVADATAYLLERKGDVTGALALALRTLSSRLASLRAALQAASLRDVAAEMAFMNATSPSKRPSGGVLPTLKASMSGGSSGVGGLSVGAGSGVGGVAPRAGTAAWARWASKVALEGLQEVLHPPAEFRACVRAHVGRFLSVLIHLFALLVLCGCITKVLYRPLVQYAVHYFVPGSLR